MAVYGRAQLHDLGAAVGRLPDLFDNGSKRQALKATGTDSVLLRRGDEADARCDAVAPKGDNVQEDLRLNESPNGEQTENEIGRKPLKIKVFEADCDH